jgi:hypothetical protein
MNESINQSFLDWRSTLPPRRVGFEKGVRTSWLLNGPKEKWKPDIEAIKATIRFLEINKRINLPASG